MKVKVIAKTGENLNATAAEAVKEVKQRAGQKGQFLNWIKVLPENQLKELDNIFAMAEKMGRLGIFHLQNVARCKNLYFTSCGHFESKLAEIFGIHIFRLINLELLLGLRRSKIGRKFGSFKTHLAQT